MSTFCFVHPETNEIHERVYQSYKDVPKYIKVEGVKCERCAMAEIAGQGGQQASTWPVHSNALGMSQKEDQEKYRNFLNKKGLDVNFDSRGRMILRTKKHRKAVCEALGYTDMDGGHGDPFCG